MKCPECRHRIRFGWGDLCGPCEREIEALLLRLVNADWAPQLCPLSPEVRAATRPAAYPSWAPRPQAA
jgi:hypothetical protein